MGKRMSKMGRDPKIDRQTPRKTEQKWENVCLKWAEAPKKTDGTSVYRTVKKRRNLLLKILRDRKS